MIYKIRKNCDNMDFQDLVDTPRKVKIVVGTITLLLLFPIYFASVPSLINGEVGEGRVVGLSGILSISFEENETTITESILLDDEESYETIFDIDIENDKKIGYVQLSVTCFDNDDPGPGFTDSVEGSSDLSSVDGEIDDQSGDGECSGGDSGFTFRWDVTENYTGDSYSEEGNEDEIRDKWSDQGHGRGSWKAMITAQINSPPGPVIGDIVDSDEEFVITWTLMTYELTIIENSS